MAINFKGKKLATSPVPKGLVGVTAKAVVSTSAGLKPAKIPQQLAEPEQEQVVVAAKPKAAAVAEVQHLTVDQTNSELSKLIDKCVELKAVVDQAAPAVKAFGVVKKDLQLIADETGEASQEVKLVAESGASVTYSAKKASSSVDPAAKNVIIGLFKELVKEKIMTYDDLMGMISFSQGDVEKYLGADVVAKYYKTIPNSGPRVLLNVTPA